MECCVLISQSMDDKSYRILTYRHESPWVDVDCVANVYHLAMQDVSVVEIVPGVCIGAQIEYVRIINEILLADR